MQAEETIDYHFRNIWHSISRIYNTEAQKYGITMSIGYTLITISKEGTPSTKLGPLMGMEPRSLTRMLKSLEEKGWIYRKQDAKDKRMVRIFLTEVGKEKRKLAKKAVLTFNEKVQDKMTKTELKGFFKTCVKLSNVLDKNEIFEQKLN